MWNHARAASHFISVAYNITGKVNLSLEIELKTLIIGSYRLEHSRTVGFELASSLNEPKIDKATIYIVSTPKGKILTNF